MVGRCERCDCRSATGGIVAALALSALLGACALPTPLPAARAPAPPPTAAIGREGQARYERTTVDALPVSADADWVAAWPAWRQSCSVLMQRAPWQETCRQAASVDATSAASIRAYFARNFDVHRVVAVADGETRDAGLVTGYYEPLVMGSRKPSTRYREPLYRVPNDLVVVDLASVYPELAGLRLRGRLQGQRLTPYLTRGEIVKSGALRGQELLWIEDPIEAFFLQVQGSGRVRLDDGSTIRVGYAEHNGHPYRSIGRWLVDQGELTLDQASMQGIKAWAARHPQRLNELLAQNPSFVFFRELPLGDPVLGPKGSLGVALTPGVSLAADPRFIPAGAPLLLATTDPATGAAIVRPMVVQDTGAAIRGPLRFDFFWGYGGDAANKAGRQRHDGTAWVLTPKGVAPEALLGR